MRIKVLRCRLQSRSRFRPTAGTDHGANKLRIDWPATGSHSKIQPATASKKEKALYLKLKRVPVQGFLHVTGF